MGLQEETESSNAGHAPAADSMGQPFRVVVKLS